MLTVERWLVTASGQCLYTLQQGILHCTGCKKELDYSIRDVSMPLTHTAASSDVGGYVLRVQL
ncbi:hypothetical protein BJF96_g8169 [Verticillium dahliae]|uniref:Uncharacterized protein n=1 Tax=Verticillium dahliae TaxID=27337 RepID=A0AA44WD35_VERDA|nr:hypothetical protein BJF96_g8169 [Verticillium dahliae]PNH55123.1 hypothetical protein VD0003_g2441 [Verticillium dahliae]